MTTISRASALALVAGGIAATALPARAQAVPADVRIGAMSIDPFGEAYYGIERGFFKDNGVNATVQTLPNGSTIVQAVLGGDLDVGMANIVTVAAALTKGLPVQMLTPAALYSAKHSYSRLCVAKSATFKSAKDLEGATIAVSSLNDFNQLGVSAWLDHNGVAPSKVKFIELKFPEMGPALQRGTVQAATIAEPALSGALTSGEAKMFVDVYGVIAPEFANIVWFATKAWLQKNPDVAKHLLAGIYASGRWANANPAQSAQILAKVAKIDPAVVLAMTRALYATSNDPKYVQAPLDFATRYGLLNRTVTTAEFIAP